METISVTAVLDENDKPLDPGFDRVFREYYAFVYRTAYGVTGRAEDAEDVAQTIFLRLIRREFPPDLRKSPKAYLYRAAFNQSVSVIRTRRRHRATADDGEASPPAPLQTRETAKPAPPQFDVVSIRKLPPEAFRRRDLGFSPGGFRAPASTLKELVLWAYDLKVSQVSGGPSWIDSDRFG